MAVEEWEIRVTNELLAWISTLDERTKAQVVDAIDRLAEAGPALGRPLVDTITHSSVRNLKELRPGPPGAARCGSCSRSTRGGPRSCSPAATSQATGAA